MCVHYRRPVSHRLQGLQAEPLVQRREDKDLSRIVESAQHLDRNESQEANIVLHSAADHRAPQVRIAGNVVSNNDELQVRKRLVLFQFGLQRREGFDHAYDVLVRTDSAGIEQEGICDLVTFGNQLTVGRAGVSMKKSFIDRVVNYLDASRRNIKQLLHFQLGKF